MKDSQVLCTALLTALLATPDASCAAEHGWYIGAAYANVSADYAPTPELAYPTDFDNSSRLFGGDADPIGSQGFKLMAGYRLLDWLAIEADYLDLDGDTEPLEIFCVTLPCPDRIRADLTSASLSALALWPLGKFDIFARVGVSRWNSKIETFNPDGSRFWSQDVTNNDGKFGAGAQLHFHKVMARLEYERLRFGGDAADTWSIGVAYSFR
jgi:opacity protein-like surface antigen